MDKSIKTIQLLGTPMVEAHHFRTPPHLFSQRPPHNSPPHAQRRSVQIRARGMQDPGNRPRGTSRRGSRQRCGAGAGEGPGQGSTWVPLRNGWFLLENPNLKWMTAGTPKETTTTWINMGED